MARTRTRRSPGGDADSGLVSDDHPLRLANIVAGYGGVNVLWDVSLEVPRGTVLAVVGANGAGKTSALRTAAGLLKPVSGRVLIDGADATTMSPAERARMGLCLIPEGRGIYRSLSVRENLRLHIPTWMPEQSVAPAIEAFPVLGRRLNQQAGLGGEQQMLALSRAYLSNPKVVVVDEVSMGLAPLLVGEIFASLEGLRESGVSLLVVEQYVTRVLQMADLACVLTRGRVSYFGRVDALSEEMLSAAYLGTGKTVG